MSQKFVVTPAAGGESHRVFDVARAHRDGRVDPLGSVQVRGLKAVDAHVSFVAYPDALGGIPSGTYRSMRRACNALDRFAVPGGQVLTEGTFAEGMALEAGEAEEDSALAYVDAALAASAALPPDVQAQADAVVEAAQAEDAS